MRTKKAIKTHLKRSEFQEQVIVFKWAKLCENTYPQLKLLHASLNGVRLTIGQAVKAKDSGMKRGIPDINLPFACKEYSQLYIEMKVDKNKLTKDQEELKELLIAGGSHYVVAYSADEAIKAITEYLKKCPVIATKIF